MQTNGAAKTEASSLYPERSCVKVGSPAPKRSPIFSCSTQEAHGPINYKAINRSQVREKSTIQYAASAGELIIFWRDGKVIFPSGIHVAILRYRVSDYCR